MEILFWFFTYLVIHPFLIYPYSLVLLSRLRDWYRGVDQGLVQSAPSPESPASSRWEPRVALVISTYNEGKSIESKLRNSEELDYPEDRLHVYLLSDGCDDETMSTAARFSNTTVFHSEIRRGKSAVIEEFVPGIDTDILVFSDANSLYDSRAIRFLVEPFRDPSMGYVVGCQKYFEAKNLPAAEAENVYWNRESWIKSLESQLGSVVGGDGAIYAIRRSDYVSL
ncbi:MAG: glycosyltransferase, partial [Planctomycetes bacterium]|nr:glycosyltransferase [Planctomycetota bacterium]